MFLSILDVRIGAGLVESLNPIAISQQFESAQTNYPFLIPLTLNVLGMMLIIYRFITIFQREIIKQRLRMRK